MGFKDAFEFKWDFPYRIAAGFAALLIFVSSNRDETPAQSIDWMLRYLGINWTKHVTAVADWMSDRTDFVGLIAMLGFLLSIAGTMLAAARSQSAVNQTRAPSTFWLSLLLAWQVGQGSSVITTSLWLVIPALFFIAWRIQRDWTWPFSFFLELFFGALWFLVPVGWAVVVTIDDEKEKKVEE